MVLMMLTALTGADGAAGAGAGAGARGGAGDCARRSGRQPFREPHRGRIPDCLVRKTHLLRNFYGTTQNHPFAKTVSGQT